MPRYYCDYCDTYLTHDSPSVRKQHNAGYKHKANVRTYYQQFEEQQTQILIDQRIKEHLGQTAVFQQVGGVYSQHLMAQRPRFPVLPPPMMPAMQPPFNLGMRPPVLPRPLGAPGMPPMMAPPGAPFIPGQLNSLPRPPTMMMVPTSIAGSTTPLASNGASSVVTSAPPYQANLSAPTSGGFENVNNNAQNSEGNH